MSTKRVVSEIGNIQLGESWMTGHTFMTSLQGTSNLLEGFDYFNDRDVTKHVGYTVETQGDMFETKSDTPLSDRVTTTANILANESLTDDEILDLLGMLRNNIHTHFSPDINPGMVQIVGEGSTGRHSVIQPAEFMEWAARSCNDKIMAAGYLRDGSILYAVGAPPDGVDEFAALKSQCVLFITSYDRTLTCRASPVAILEKTGMPIVLSRKVGWNFKHTKNMAERVLGKVQDWEITAETWRFAVGQMKEMSEIVCDFGLVVDKIQPETDDPRSQSTRSDLWAAYNNHTCEQFRGSLFAAYEAVIAYDALLRRVNGAVERDERQLSQVTGYNNAWLDKAIKVIESVYGKRVFR